MICVSLSPAFSQMQESSSESHGAKMRWADLLGNNYDLKVYRFQMRVIFIFSDSKTIKQSLRGKVSELGREEKHEEKGGGAQKDGRKEGAVVRRR